MGSRAWTWATAVAAAAVVSAGGAQASALFQNGSFEHDVDNWVLTDPGNSFTASGWNHFPLNDNNQPADHSWDRVNGDFMVILQPDEPDNAVEISQTFTITTLSHLTGWAAFLGRDYIDPDGTIYNGNPPAGTYNDTGYVRLDGFVNDLFYADIAGVGNFGWTPWTRFDLDLAPGTYTIRIGVTNGTDNFNPSQLIADGIFVDSLVPEPATWAMMIGGFFGLGGLLRRRRAVVA